MNDETAVSSAQAPQADSGQSARGGLKCTKAVGGPFQGRSGHLSVAGA
jgi:hypothetical protein